MGIQYSIALFLCLLLVTAVHGQQPTFAEVFAGKTVPLSVKFGEMQAGWRQLTLSLDGQGDTPLPLMERLYTSGRAGTYYTNGQTLTVSGTPYLVAYAQPTSPADLFHLMQNDATDPAPLTVATPLTLALLDIRSGGSLLNIRPLVPEQAIADEAQAKSQRDDFTLAELFSGKNIPLSMVLGEMGEGWWQFMPDWGSPAGKAQQQAMLRLVNGNTGIYFTQGHTITAEGESFLVAYALPTPPIDARTLMENHNLPPLDPPGPKTALCLSLLNQRTGGHLLDLRPVDLQALQKELKHISEQELKTRSLNNLKQLAVAVLMYVQDHDETFPAEMSDTVAMKNILQHTPIVIRTQPQTDQPYLANPNLAGASLWDIKDPSVAVIFYEATPWPDGTRCVVFADGHAETISAERWEDFKEKNNLP